MKEWAYLSSSQREKLTIYEEGLRHFNKSVPLYSRSQGKDFCRELILDCLIAGKLLLEDSRHQIIADIGSGAGFPGLVLAVLAKDREFWLFEPNKKKAGFLEHIRWKMSLPHVLVKNGPVQQEKTSHLHCAVSKAFLALEKRLTLTGPVFARGACYYHLQSFSEKPLWQTLPQSVQKSWKLVWTKPYNHPLLPGTRMLLKTVKK